MSNMSRTFSDGDYSRTYSTKPKPFQFVMMHQAGISPLTTPSTQRKPKKESRGACKVVCCCLLTCCVSTIIAAVVALGVAALVTWLVLRPIHLPSYELHDIAFSRFAYASDSHALDAAFAYTLVADNPNDKIGFKYDHITIDTTYMDQVLAPSTRIPGFYHGHRKVTNIPEKVATEGVELDSAAGDTLDAQIAAKSTVTLVMLVRVRAQMKIGIVRTPWYSVRVKCDVSFEPTSEGKVPKDGVPETVACSK